MKKHFLIISLILGSYPSFLSAQNFPFPTDAEWINVRVSACIGGSLVYTVWREYLHGDTILDDANYHKLYLRPACTRITSGAHCDASLTIYEGPTFNIGAVRETNQQVFLRRFNTTGLPVNFDLRLDLLPLEQDILLYDFNWAVGDTFTTTFNDGTALLYEVSNLTTTTEGRKKFTLTHITGIPYTQETIEGIGNVYGFFGNYTNPTGSAFVPLNGCLNTNGLSLLTSEWCTLCGGSIETTPEPIGTILKIYPNPADDKIHLEIPASGDREDHYYLEVYNLQGKLLYAEKDFSDGYILSTAGIAENTWLSVVLTDTRNGHTWSSKVQVTH